MVTMSERVETEHLNPLIRLRAILVGLLIGNKLYRIGLQVCLVAKTNEQEHFMQNFMEILLV